jgi:hypothetical protein
MFCFSLTRLWSSLLSCVAVSYVHVSLGHDAVNVIAVLSELSHLNEIAQSALLRRIWDHKR